MHLSGHYTVAVGYIGKTSARHVEGRGVNTICIIMILPLLALSIMGTEPRQLTRSRVLMLQTGLVKKPDDSMYLISRPITVTVLRRM